MRLPIFGVLLVAALLGTAAALRLSFTVNDRDGIAYATALSGGTFAVWLLVTVSAFNVVTVSNGTEIANSYPALGVFGVLGAGVATLILAQGSIRLLDS